MLKVRKLIAFSAVALAFQIAGAHAFEITSDQTREADGGAFVYDGHVEIVLEPDEDFEISADAIVEDGENAHYSGEVVIDLEGAHVQADAASLIPLANGGYKITSQKVTLETGEDS
ncbi:hypothetical protein E1178_01630 [Roseibium hamelinense]|nr:hypothetical protein [Roseibium hamelinense]MTI42308.1 hypothetical protein [Roseibium hamelinense]